MHGLNILPTKLDCIKIELHNFIICSINLHNCKPQQSEASLECK